MYEKDKLKRCRDPRGASFSFRSGVGVRMRGLFQTVMISILVSALLFFLLPARDAFAQPGPDDPAVIDVMVVYTPAAQQWAEGRGGIDNVINLAMMNAETALDNSDTGITLRLVHSAEVDYEESGDDALDLRNLTQGNIGNVHEWRDENYADLVAMFQLMEDWGGLAWQLQHPGGMPDWAFSITHVPQAAATYTFIHELGHNMGAQHDVENAYDVDGNLVGGLFEYSHGWRWEGADDQLYRSVMAYPPGMAVGHFSDPSIEHQGEATGDEGAADNARTLREIKHVIAAYREREEEPDGWTLDILAPQGEGATDPPTGEHVYGMEEVASVTAFPADGWIFDGWILDNADAGDDNPITVSSGAGGEKRELQAIFESEDEDDDDDDPAPAEGFVVVGGGSGTRSGVILTSSDGFAWTIREPGDTRRSLSDVAYGNGTYVAAGRWGVILRSSDEINWTVDNPGAGDHLNAIAYGGGRFVAVGENGAVLSSGDGVDWARHNSGARSTFYGVTYGNNEFIAVGARGVVMASPDGETWTRRNSRTRARLNDIAYGDGVYVAIGQWGNVLISTDGETWARHDSGFRLHLNGVAYGNGRFVAVGDRGAVTVARSESPDTWTHQTDGVGYDLGFAHLYGAGYGEGLFLAVGEDGNILSSSDGGTWTQQDSQVPHRYLRDVVFGRD